MSAMKGHAEDEPATKVAMSKDEMMACFRRQAEQIDQLEKKMNEMNRRLTEEYLVVHAKVLELERFTWSIYRNSCG
jgi:hypothetical protein